MKGAPSRQQFWAKLHTDDRQQITEWHPLLAHSADVAAAAEAILERSILRRRLATLAGWTDLDEVQIARLCVLVAIHDAGKVNHGFQNRAHADRNPREGHVGPIVEILESDEPRILLLPLGIAEIVDWFPDERILQRFLLASWGHHGRPVMPNGDFRADLWRPNADRDPIAGLQGLADAVRAWFPKAFDGRTEKFPDTPVFQHAFNGLVTLADWMGSDRRFFDYADEGSDHIVRARQAAAQLLENLAFDVSKPLESLGPTPVGFEAFADFQPFEIQRACLDLPLHQQGSLTVLESDTGSGKTEAAIARFLRLYQSRLVDGMYFALPTRSAATQLHDRIRHAVARAFPDDERRPPVVQAVPGYFRVDDIEGVPLGPFHVHWSDDREEWLRARAWAAEHPKRYLAGAVVVGTVDQVLLSALQVRHAHMRATALLRHFLVVDEIHASDSYMTRVLETVLEHHLAAGGHALLMSATLGVSARVRLTTPDAVVPSAGDAVSQPYPLVAHVDSERSRPLVLSKPSSGSTKQVLPETVAHAGDPEMIARRAIDAAAQGARVLIIRNRVVDCVDLQRHLMEQAANRDGLLFGVHGIAAPHHSRFAKEDRQLLDRAVGAAFGRSPPPGGMVCAATQTVEQSLDIDADLLLTDLCPVDVLLQRIGRLHRHDRNRPAGFEHARCIVLLPRERDLGQAINADGRALNGKHGLGTVYHDLRPIEATWRLLEEHRPDVWSIPTDNRDLVERATHPERLAEIVAELGAPWDSHEEYILGTESANRFLAGFVTIDRSRPFGDDTFADDLDKVRTRLGQDDYQIKLPRAERGPFDRYVRNFTVAGWQLNGRTPDDVIADHVTRHDATLIFEVGGTTFQYDRLGLAPMGSRETDREAA